MIFDHTILSHELRVSGDRLDGAVHYASVMDDVRGRARQIWNDACAREMNVRYLDPICAHWNTAKGNLTAAADDLQSSLSKLYDFESAQSDHAHAAERVMLAISEFKARVREMDSLRDHIHHQFAEFDNVQGEVVLRLNLSSKAAAEAGS